jgi:hypothetical protein
MADRISEAAVRLVPFSSYETMASTAKSQSLPTKVYPSIEQNFPRPSSPMRPSFIYNHKSGIRMDTSTSPMTRLRL